MRQADNAETKDRPGLRFITCGSVDDGKSTLIGRLLYEQGQVASDVLQNLERDSRRFGTAEGDLDFSLLVDGLQAEREQHITIDVAYRYFSTPKRSFIVADTPGHEQYTRNMATGASNAELAILLVDARKGLLPQTRRHAIIVSLLGVEQLVLAINKMDLVDFNQDTFDAIVAEFTAFATGLGIGHINAVPVCANQGDNISTLSPHTLWYDGKTLVDLLETAETSQSATGLPMRFPVQWVNRPDADFRGYSGTLASGELSVGDEVVIAGSGQQTAVTGIIAPSGKVERAHAGQAITLTLAGEQQVSRGDVLTHREHRPQTADQFAAHLIWMGEEHMLPGRSYLLKSGAMETPVSVTEIKHRVDVNTLGQHAAKFLALNEIGFCNFATDVPLAFDAYSENRQTGSFILIDRMTNATVAAGMISFALRRATNIHRQELTVNKQQRIALKQHQPAILWFTGLSGAGKSAIANAVEAELNHRSVHSIMLDGDNIRHGLNKDLGFTDADRVENIRRIGEVAKLMADAGLIILCAFISPFRSDRQMAREIADSGEFIEVHVATSIDDCIQRDPKGLYKKALAGEIKNFTGIDQPYEAPDKAEIVLDGGQSTPAAHAKTIISYLETHGIITNG